MATFQEVKAFIDDKIKDNENGEITGSVLNEALTLLLGISEEYQNDVVIREFKTDNTDDAKAYNLETISLVAQNNNVLVIGEGGVATAVESNVFMQTEVIDAGYGAIISSIKHVIGTDGTYDYEPIHMAGTPKIINFAEDVAKWYNAIWSYLQLGVYASVFVEYEGTVCYVDATRLHYNNDFSKFVIEFNNNSKRYQRVYDASTGEEISTTEIPLGTDADIYPTEYSDEFNDDFTN